MGWFKVDDNYFTNIKVIEAGEEAADLNLRGMAYCSANQTDGKIPHAAVDLLTRKRDVSHLIDALLDVGLWKKTAKFYVIHDYLEHQSSRAQIRAKTEGAAKRKRTSRARHAVTDAAGHTNVRAPEAEAEPQADTDTERITPGLETSSSLQLLQPVVAREEIEDAEVPAFIKDQIDRATPTQEQAA